MALHDLARMSVSGTPGTGDITLGSAVDGGVTFAAAGVGDGETVTYAVEDGSNREVRSGVYTASGTTLSRGTLLASTTGSTISLTSAAKVFITPVADDLNLAMNGNLAGYFGTGLDGDATISGSTTLVRDMHYRNLTMASGGFIVTNGFEVFVSGTLEDTGNVAGAFRQNGNQGGNSPGAGAGGTAAVFAGTTLGGWAVSGAGAAGTTGVGAVAPSITAAAANNGGRSGDGGKGGNGTPNAGGALRAGITALADLRYVAPTRPIIRANALVPGGLSGPGGSSGGGDGTNTGRGGGGGGTGGGVIRISARRIVVTGSTPAAWIQTLGGIGGNGGTGASGNVGGGGGGCGGGGGHVTLIYAIKEGPTVTGLISVAGGKGGDGFNGAGTGIGGDGGRGGDRGRVTLMNLTTGVKTELAPSGAQAAAATVATTFAGTAGTASVVGSVDL